MGKIFVVGIGPGNRLDMTARAAAALEQSDIIAGYTVYVDLVRSQFPKKIGRASCRERVLRCV